MVRRSVHPHGTFFISIPHHPGTAKKYCSHSGTWSISIGGMCCGRKRHCP